jgi:hypothetical protein
LFALGVCLFCLKGVPEVEDVLLNLAGLAAPVIAIVPTPHAGTCTSVTFEADRGLNIHNNVATYLCMVAAGLVVIGIIGGRNYAAAYRRHELEPAQFITHLVGYLLAVAAFVAAWILFAFDFETFQAHAHDWAASTTFGAINVVALLNCYYWAKKQEKKEKGRGGTAGLRRRWLQNPYTYIAAGMILSFVVIDGVVTKTVAQDWHQSTLVLETCQILLFALFWLIQTAELWRPGLRIREIGSPESVTEDLTAAPAPPILPQRDSWEDERQTSG